MSKSRTSRGPAARSAGPITPDSSHVAILREKIRVRTEIIRRQAYQDLLALRAELEGLPPLPPSHAPPANED